MEECKRMKLPVLGPDVNESFYKFSVNKDNAVRFGMGAIKGVGHGAVMTIVENRKKDGNYQSIFDLAKRIDLRAANKKAFEGLALAGGFDCFDNHRAQYFYKDGTDLTFLEKAVRYGAKHQENENSAQVSLFGAASDVQIEEPTVPPCENWGTMEKLAREKEVVGIYISGHPLDDFKTEIKTFCNGTVSQFKDLQANINKDITFGGVVTDVQHRVSKQGKGWAMFTIEDYNDSFEFRIFGEDYLKHRPFLLSNTFVYVKAFIREGWVNRDTGKAGEPRIQFNSFQLLHDVLENYTRKLSIQLDIKELEERKIVQLKELIAMHPGKKPMTFEIFDMKEKVKLVMPSRRQKVTISQELLHELDEQEVNYKLN